MTTSRLVTDTRAWVRPRGEADKRGVLFCHGNTQDEMVLVTEEFFGQRRLIHAMAEDGRVVMCDENGGAYAWGKDSSMVAVDEAVAAARALPSWPPGPFHLVGVSMGFQMAAVWARTHLADVASIAGIIPVTDVADIWTFNRAGLRFIINTAYPPAYSIELNGPTKDPMMFAEDLATIADKIKLWYSTGDTIITPASVRAFAAAAGVLAIPVNGGEHSEEAVEAAPRADVLAWLNAHE